MPESLLEYALAYAAGGWPVIPLHSPTVDDECSCGKPTMPATAAERVPGVRYCGSPAKHPRTAHGLEDATTDVEQVRRWWKQWPDANIGMVTGEQSFIVVDIDSGKGGLDSWQQLLQQHGELDDEISQRTGGGGFHYLFADPGWKVSNNQNGKLGMGIDIRGRGGYIVAAPSRHISGAEYEWIAQPNGHLPKMPDWLLEKLRPKEAPKPVEVPAELPPISDKYAAKALEGELEKVRAAVEGNRNNQLNASAYSLGQFVPSGALSRFEIEAALFPAAVAIGLDEDEARKTIRSGISAGAQEPRTIPERSAKAQVATKPRVAKAEARKQVAPSPAEVDAVLRQIAEGEGEAASEEGEGTSHPRDWRRSQEGLAREFLQRYGSEFRFLADLTKDGGKNLFAHYDGNRWQMFGPAIAALAKRQREMTAEYRNYTKEMIRAAGAVEALSKEEKAAYQFSLSIEAARWQSDWVKMLRGFDEIHRATSQFDADPYLLNCLNGTVDLRTGELRPHRQADYLSKMIAVEYDPDAQCPQWEKFVSDIQSGDREMVDFLQRGIGYSLTGDPKEECLMICHGVGRNGKGTFLNTLAAILGDYGGSALMSTFEEKRTDAGANNDLAMLKGLRFVVGSETKERSRLNEQLVKQVTGRDRLRARFLFSEFFEFVFEGKLWLMVNHLPTIPGTDEGIWSRIRIVPFLRYFKFEERDPYLKDKLMEEAKGILAWAVRGCLEWQKVGLNPPAGVMRATEVYRESQDVMGQFLAECCLVDQSNKYLKTRASDLYRAYQQWCEKQGNRFPVSMTAFGRKLGERGFEKDDDRYPNRIGIGLLVQPEDSNEGTPPQRGK